MAFWLAFGNEIIGGALLFRTRPKGKLYSLCFGAGWPAGWLQEVASSWKS